MSLDAEAQEDELLALASIYEESFTASQVEAEGAEAGGAERVQGGVLAIHLDLPPDFTLLSRATKDKGKYLVSREVFWYII